MSSCESRERRPTVPQVFPESRTLSRWRDSSLCFRAEQAQRRQLVARDPLHILTIDLHPAIQLTHRPLVEQSTQQSEGGHSRGRLPVQPVGDQRRCLVRWKEMPVVDERHQIVARQQSVGRIAIDYIDRSRGQCLILYCRRQWLHLARSEAVDSRQSYEAIASADEVCGEPGGDVRALTGKIAQSPQSVAFRGRACDCNGISVLESERRQPSRLIELAESRCHVRKHSAR